MRFAPQRRAIFEHRNFKKWPESVVFCAFWLTNALLATAACHFNMGTSKSGPREWCFAHFDLQTHFSPQRRAILTSELQKVAWECGVLHILTYKCASRHSVFPDRNFQNWSRPEVFCTFWLGNMLRATAVCHFSSVCKNRYLRTRRFTEPTFRTSGSTNHWKNTAIRDVPNISRTRTFVLVTLHACWSSFYWLYTRVDLLSADLTSLLCFSTLLTWHLYSAFQLCVLSEVRLLNFLRSNHTFTVNLPQLFGIYVGVFFV